MKRLLPFAAVAAALAVPGVASAAGVVLKVDRAHATVAVVQGHRVALAHTTAAAHLRVGQEVRFASTRRSDGTVTASNVHVVGHAKRVSFRGYLLAENRSRLLVSAGGAVVKLDSPPTTTTATPGSTVAVTATVTSDDQLDDEDVSVVSASSPGGRFEGQVAAIGSGTITVVSENMALVLKVPSTVDLTGVQVGDEVLATFAQGSDGTLTLTALSDEDQQGDDDNGGDGGGGSGSGGSGSGVSVSGSVGGSHD